MDLTLMKNGGISKVQKKNQFISKLIRDKYLYLFLLPVMAYYIIFKYIPIAGIIIAFKEYNLTDGMFGSPWVGFKQFELLFASRDFYTTLMNTVLLNLYLLVFSFPFPIFLALLLNEVKNRFFKRTVQSALYLPHFISWVVLGGIVISVLSPSTGIVNYIFSSLGFGKTYFMASEKWWPGVFVTSEIWQSAGWGTIIYMAAITGVDPDLYEAATIDGASKWQQIINITLPCIGSTIIIMLILRMGKMLDLGFEQVYALQNDAVRSVSEVISTYEYRIGLQGMQYSYTTALSLFKGVVGLIFITITNKIANFLGENGLW